MQEVTPLCHCPYNEKVKHCVIGDCQDYVIHLATCKYSQCELCVVTHNDKYNTSLFDRHTQDCFFNGCTTDAHKGE